jgi:hypothetical protein
METNKRITMDELSMKLANSKKIMKKVDSGNYEKGNINQDVLNKAPEELMENGFELKNVAPVSSAVKRPVGTATPEKINNSKLPESIKRAMIENPIPQISLNDTIDMDFVAKTKRLMEQDEPKQSTQTRQVTQVSSKDFEAKLIPIIENIIRKTLDEIVDKKLTQILTAYQTASINENLVLKVGNSIFQGKITNVKSSK